MKKNSKILLNKSATLTDDITGLLNSEIFNFFSEATDDLIFILDKNGSIIYVNKKALQILNCSKNDIINNHLLNLIEEADKTEISKHLCKILKENNSVSFEAGLIINKTNKLPLNLKAKSVTFNNKIFFLIIASGQNAENEKIKFDYTLVKHKLTEANRLLELERSRLKKDKLILEELNNLKADFITNISHELRTPISSIVGFSEAIANDVNLNEENRKEFNQIILNEGKRLAKLIDELLDETREERGTPFLERSEVDLNKLLKEIITGVQEKIEAKGIIFSYEIPEEPSNIIGDKERIIRALVSLIDNAIFYTNKGGRIKIIAKDFDNETEIILSDTGIGLSGNQFSNIFDNTISIRQKNPANELGFGLILVKNVVDLHNGFFSVQSEKDKGTTFLLKFPKNVDNY